MRKRWIAAAVAVGLLTMFWPRWRMMNDYLVEYMTAAPRIEAGSTLLSLVYSHHGTTSEGRSYLPVGSFSRSTGLPPSEPQS